MVIFLMHTERIENMSEKHSVSKIHKKLFEEYKLWISAKSSNKIKYSNERRYLEKLWNDWSDVYYIAEDKISIHVVTEKHSSH